MNTIESQGASAVHFRKIIIWILFAWFLADFFMSWRFGWRLTMTSEMYEVRGFRDFVDAAENNYAKFFLKKLQHHEKIEPKDRAAAFTNLLAEFLHRQKIAYKLIDTNSVATGYNIVQPSSELETRLLAEMKANNFTEFPYYDRISSGHISLLRSFLPLCLKAEDSLVQNSGIDNCILVQLTTPMVSSLKRDPNYALVFLSVGVLMLIMEGLFIEFYLTSVGKTYADLKNINKTLDQKVLARSNQLEAAKRELSAVISKLDATEKQRIAQEKMASIGLLASGIAHEIGNPLNFISNFADINREILAELRAEVINMAITDESKQSMLEIIENTEQAMDQIIVHGKGTQSVVQQLQLHAADVVAKKPI